MISKVETLKKYRGRGYATLAVSAALEDALKKVGEEEMWIDLGTGLVP